MDLTGTLQADGRTLTRRDSWRSLPCARHLGTGRSGKASCRPAACATPCSRAWNRGGCSWGRTFAIHPGQPALCHRHPQPHLWPGPGNLTPGFDTRDRQRATGLFVQDQMDLSERWKLLAGVRFDRYHQDYENRLNQHRADPVALRPPRRAWGDVPRQRPHLGVCVGRAFLPPQHRRRRERPCVRPAEGKAFELGAKWQSADQRLNGSVALFDIRKTNVLTRSPTNANYNVAAGEVRSRGLEADLAGQIDAHWRMTANLATRCRVVRDNNPALLGKRLLNVPRVSAGLFAIREDRLASGGRWGVGGGLVHVGERTGTATDTYRLPAYTTARLTSYWQIDKRTRLTLDVHNLFDKTYYTASWGNLTVIPGLGRQVVAGVQVAF